MRISFRERKQNKRRKEGCVRTNMYERNLSLNYCARRVYGNFSRERAIISCRCCSSLGCTEMRRSLSNRFLENVSVNLYMKSSKYTNLLDHNCITTVITKLALPFNIFFSVRDLY